MKKNKNEQKNPKIFLTTYNDIIIMSYKILNSIKEEMLHYKFHDFF